MRQARREREAAEAMEKLGGAVYWSEPSGPVWLRKLIGDDLFIHVEILGFRGFSITDADLDNLTGLSQLQMLDLRGTNITDKGLENLRGLSQLHRVDLDGTKVTDEGVKKLQESLPNCKIFTLCGPLSLP